VDEWHEFDSFVEYMFVKKPGLLRPPSNPYNWKITLLATGAGRHHHSEESEKSFWLNLEGSLLRAYIYDPLYWLGLTRLRLDDNGELNHFAISERGRAFLTDAFQPGPSGAKQRFILHPDFEITAHRDFNRSALLFLSKFAVRTELDAVFKFQISKHSISRALQIGIEAKTIISFLKKHSTAGIPQNVEYSIKEWSAKFGNIRIRDAVILETADEFLMTEIMASGKITAGVQERVGKKTAIIDRENSGTIYKDLKREGYLPEIDEDLKRLGAEVQAFTLPLQQSVAVFAAALGMSEVLDLIQSEFPALKKLLVDEEALSSHIPYKLMLRASFIASELSDLILNREPISMKHKGEKRHLRLQGRSQKAIMDDLGKAQALGKPVVIEYTSPITSSVRFRKLVVSEIIGPKNEGYIRGIDSSTGRPRAIAISAIQRVSDLG
ncbi:MAG: helicase-associated domain-containing protein, partial [Candidatus Coatesbacteria bacterium]|nr:helicase-associated domain-containing protein [Candidatus Coatesbacteria bacterium]